MAKVDTALWRDIMDYLRRRHAPICRQWFESLEPLELDSGLLRIYTANSVQQNYLQNKCRDPFTEAAQAVTGALVVVQFITGADPRPSAAPQPDIRHADHAGGVSTGISGGKPLDPRSVEIRFADPHHPNTTAAAHVAAAGATAAGSVITTAPATATFSANASGNSHLPAPSRIPPPPPRPVESPNRPAPSIIPQSSPGNHTYTSTSQPQQSNGETVAFEQIVICPDYSFENFVSGPNNRLAYAASVAVANQPGTAYNPLFIHGGCGLGKTHLLQAICQQIISQRPDLRICYLSCDAFMNQFIDCVQQGKMSEFRHRYRHVDLLVIDDIHFLANKERSQEEFFHTFNELYQSNRQIVLSSDSPPNEIPQLEERLVSRFQWGLVANVSKPDFETRIAIVRAKARLRGLELPDEVINYIANRVDSNARELEGALTTIQGHAALQSRAINLQLAQEALGENTLSGGASQATLQAIIDAVTAFYNVKLSDLQSKRRHKSITEPRQVCMWLARKRTRFSLEEIGGYFGGRDHTTVMHSIRITDHRIATDPHYARQVSQLEERLAQVR